MDIGIVRGLLTAVILILFVGIGIWTFSRKRHEDFDAASRMPLGDDTRPPANEEMKERQS